MYGFGRATDNGDTYSSTPFTTTTGITNNKQIKILFLEEAVDTNTLLLVPAGKRQEGKVHGEFQVKRIGHLTWWDLRARRGGERRIGLTCIKFNSISHG